MNLIELKKQMASKQLDNFYIFTGEEIRIMDIFLQKISEILGCEIITLDSAVSYYNKLGSNNFFKKPCLYIIRDDMDYIKQNEAIWNKVIKRSKNSPYKAVFVYSSLDKRSKFYKFFENYIVDFVKLADSVVINYLKKDYDINNEEAKYIVVSCSSNYNMSLLECDKIQHLAEFRNISFSQAFALCKNFGILNRLPTEDLLSEFINSFLSKNFSICLNLVSLFDLKSDPPLKIIAYLYNSFRALFSIVAFESGLSNKKNESGANFWVVKNVEIFGRYWLIFQIRQIMKFLQETEQGIKTGNISSENVLNYVIINCYIFANTNAPIRK